GCGGAEGNVPDWPVYVALGDSLTAGRDDPGPGGGRIGWARRLAGLLTTRTSVPCTLTNLATDGAGVAAVLERQLPAVAGIGPDLVSVTVGMNDIRDPGFTEDRFAAGLGALHAPGHGRDHAAAGRAGGAVASAAAARQRHHPGAGRWPGGALPGHLGDARGQRPWPVRAGPDPSQRRRPPADGGGVRRSAAGAGRIGCGACQPTRARSGPAGSPPPCTACSAPNSRWCSRSRLPTTRWISASTCGAGMPSRTTPGCT